MPIWRAASASGSAWMRTRIFALAEHLNLRDAVDGGNLARQQGLGIFVQRRCDRIVSENMAMNMIGWSAD